MKKLLILALVLTLAFSLAACNKNNDDDNSSNENQNNNEINYPNEDGIEEDLSIKPASEGLEFELNEDGKSYSVIGIGTCKDKDIVIPETYNDLPVTATKYYFDWEFDNETFEEKLLNILNIERIFISRNITSFDFSAFTSSVFAFPEKLLSIQVDKDNSTYKSVNGNLYNKDGTTLIKYAYGKDNSHFEIPDTVTTVEKSAFANACNLVTLTIGKNVTKFGDKTLSQEITYPNINLGDGNATSSSNVVIKDAIIFEPNITYSNNEAAKIVEIYNKSQLKITVSDASTMGIPKNPLNVYTDTEGQKKTFLTEDGFIFYDDTDIRYLMGYIGDNTALNLPDTCKGKNYTIYSRAFFGNDKITSIKLSAGVEAADEFALHGCKNLANISVDDKNTTYTSINGNLYSKDKKTLVLYAYGKTDLEFETPDGVTSIADNAFATADSLEKITLKSGIKTIGDSAFVQASNLKEISIPSSIEEIGYSAFYACEKLTYNLYSGAYYIGNENNPYLVLAYGEDNTSKEVLIHENTKIILESAFTDFTEIKNIKIPNSVTFIGSQAFALCSNLISVTIGNSVTSIGESAFLGCDNLTSVTIGNGVTSIGESAFECCFKLVEVYNLSDLTITAGSQENGYVGYYALNVYTSLDIPSKLWKTEDEFLFYEDGDTCYLLGYTGDKTEINLPESCNGKNYEIYKRAFDRNDKITKVKIPNSVTSIGSYAFWSCDSLEEVHISDIGAWCNISFGNGYANPLYRAKNLYLNGNLVTELVIPDTVKEINDYAFYYYTSLTNVKIPDGVTSIGYSAFHGCYGLASITIGNSVTYIGHFAFRGCSSLTSVYYTGTAEEWSEISIGSVNDSLDNATVYYYSEEEPTEEGNFWHYVDGEIEIWPAYVAPIYSQGLEYSLSGDETYYIVSSIGTCADTDIIIPEIYEGLPVKEIGFNTFACKQNIISISIPKSILSIDSNAFWCCYDLEFFIVDESNPSYATIDGNLYNKAKTQLLNYALGKQNTSFTVPDTVTDIKSSAFQLAVTLTSIDISDNVISIGPYAFVDCYNLKSIKLGASVNSIGDDAFRSCSALETIEVSENNNAFKSIDGNLYSKDGKTLIKYALGKNESSFTIPDHVEFVFKKAFQYCVNINSVIIGNSTTDIGDYAFNSCTDLTNVIIGNGVTFIGCNTFEYCRNLTSVTIGNSVTSIGDDAFYGCNKLTYVYYSGTPIEWNKIVGVLNSSYFTSKTIYYYSEEEPDIKGNFWHYVNGEIEIWPAYVAPVYSQGLKFTLNSDGISYSVSDIGDCNDTDLIIPSTCNDLPVTSIGNYAFENCTSLTSITIPNSVTSIGYYAFYGCSSLTNVTIGNSVTSTGSSAFANCTSLISITIPDGVTSIGDGAFKNCTALTEIYFNATAMNDLSTNNNVFYNAGKDGTGIKVVIGKNVTKIPAHLFYPYSDSSYAPKIVSVEFEEGSICENIGSSAFYNCSSLTSITIPNSVTSIGNMTFAYCDSLTGVTIGDNVTSIGSHAFYNCSSLTSITIPDSVTSIGDFAFSDCINLTSITIGNSVTSIGTMALNDCRSLKEVHISDIKAWCNISFFENPLRYANNLYLNGNIISGDFVIPDGVKAIPDYTFKNSNITSIIIPNSVTSIGDFAFSDCINLTSITIGNSVTSICDYAFKNCDSLTSITIPDSVTSIGYGAFYDCTSLKEVHISDIEAWCNISFGDYSANPLYYADKLYLNRNIISGDFVIPDGVKAIPEYTFKNSNITSIIIPNSVTSIDSYAFYGCDSLTNVTIGNGVTSLGKNAFECCYNLTSVIIPDSVTSIGSDAFYNCSSLTSITIPNSVTSIGSDTFYNCSSLTSITIPNSVTSIGSFAFSGCYHLVEVYNLSDLTITAGSSNNGYVGSYAISVYNSLDIPSKQWKTEDGFLFYENGNSCYLFGYVGDKTEITLPESCNGKNYKIYRYAFYTNYKLTKVTIPDSVTSIGESAFDYCDSLTSITIGDSVTSIGRYAFSGCTSLTSITIGDSVTSIGDWAFYSCYHLVEVYNLSDLTITAGSSNNGYVGSHAISVYTSLDIPSKQWKTEDGFLFYENGNFCYLFGYTGDKTEITLPESCNGKNYEIYKYAFWDSDKITNVIIPDSVTSIGESAFLDCYNLTSVTIPDSVTSIGSYAFYYCSSLTSVTIPNSVTSIGKWAFFGCSSLTSVYYKGTAEEWAEISIGTNNDYLNNATIYYYSEEEPTKEGNFWYYDEDGDVTVW